MPPLWVVGIVRTRILGKTGLVVSELSLGTWGLSGDAYGPVEISDAEITLARALEVGVNLIETADVYGAGAMEELVGRVTAGNPDVLICTKGGTDRSTEPPRKRFDAAFLRASVERSLKRLGRSCIDLYLLHNAQATTFYHGDTVDTLDAMKREGLIAHWGASVGDMDAARAAMSRGAGALELAYNLFNAHDLHALSGDILWDKVGILARSPLGYGLLAGTWAKGREFPEGDHRRDRWSPADLERRLDQLDAVRFLVRGDVQTLRGAAVRFVLSHHLVTTAVLGPKNVTQLEQLVRETGSGPRYLPDEALRALPQALERLGIDS